MTGFWRDTQRLLERVVRGNTIKLAGMFLFTCTALWGQAFEVVSIKPSDPDARGSNLNFPNGTFTATNFPVRNLITLAYRVQPFQIEGAPRWVVDQHYDIVAKLPAGAVTGPDDPNRIPRIGAALLALLADRFQLKIHRESKSVAGYALVVAKGGFKLKEATDDGRGIDVNVGHGTGIKGVFDIKLEWTPDSNKAGEAPAGPSIFTALQEQLGFKLETQKVMVEAIVIDRIEKPTGN